MSDLVKRNRGRAEPLSLRANMLWNSAGSLIYFGCQWLLTVAVVRISGNYDAAGILALAMAVFNIVSPITVYRMFTYQISDVEHENTLGEYLSFRVIMTGVGLAFASVYSLVTCPSGSLAPIMLYLLYKMCSQFIDALHATMQLNSRMDYVGISFALQGVGSLLAFCLVFYATESLNLSFVGMIVITVLIGVLYDYPRTIIFEPVKLGISFIKVRHLLIYCFPIVVAAIACSAVPSIPRQYLAMAQGEAILGVYSSVAAPAALIQMGASYIYTPLLSAFAMRYTNQDKRGFVNLLARASIGIALVGVVAGTGLMLFGEWILNLLFGDEIVEYAYLLFPMIVCTIVTAFLWFFNDLLIAIRHFTGAFVGNIVALIVTLACTMPFVVSFGANGVSFAVIVAYLTGACILVLFLLRAAQTMRSNKPTGA